MTQSLAIDPQHTAVVTLDLQLGVAGRLPEPAPLFERVARVLGAVREAALPVMHVRVGFRPGHPEINPRNVSFTDRIKKNGVFVEGSGDTELHPSVARREGEPIVTKRRIGAFSGTELELLLRAGGIDTLILFGVATSGAVLTTVRQGFDGDYRMILVRDCCADPDPPTHDML